MQTPYEIHNRQTTIDESDIFLEQLSQQDSSTTIHFNGLSIENDPMISIETGLGNLNVAVIGGIHGNEAGSREGIYPFLRDLVTTDLYTEHLKDVKWSFLPNANPNGLRRNIRQNSSGGLDLNRDYIDREAPESKAIRAFLVRSNPHLIVDLHEHLGTNLTQLMTTGRQTHSSAPPSMQALSDDLHTAVGERMASDGYSWGLYPDSRINGAARTEASRIYMSTALLIESDRTADLYSRLSATQSVLDEISKSLDEMPDRYYQAKDEITSIDNQSLIKPNGRAIKARPLPHKHTISDIEGLSEILESLQNNKP